ncbi:hypothetical protein ACWCOV_00470 [Kribbella sp. NPDC002412]
MVPLRAMLRHHRAIRSRAPVRALCSARSLELLIYRDELMKMSADDLIDVSITLTREAPSSWRGHRGHIDPMLLGLSGWAAGHMPLTYVCGPTAFVETCTCQDPARWRDAGTATRFC